MNSYLKKKCEKLHRIREQQWTKSQDFYKRAWVWRLKSDILSLYREYRELRWHNSSKNLKIILQSYRNIFKEQN